MCRNIQNVVDFLKKMHILHINMHLTAIKMPPLDSSRKIGLITCAILPWNGILSQKIKRILKILTFHQYFPLKQQCSTTLFKQHPYPELPNSGTTSVQYHPTPVPLHSSVTPLQYHLTPVSPHSSHILISHPVLEDVEV